ncbi:MAG: magnesium transporter, partial [Desulfobacterales bacterium]|nr:magnesium transporter [Desulfobacterales bacterium]
MTQTDYDILLDSIRNMIQEKAYPDLERLLIEPHPADLADLIEHLDSEERLSVFKLLSSDRAGEVLKEISPPVQE